MQSLTVTVKTEHYYLCKGRINSRVVVLNCITLYEPNEHTVYTYSHAVYAHIHTNSIFLYSVRVYRTYIVLLRSPLQLKTMLLLRPAVRLQFALSELSSCCVLTRPIISNRCLLPCFFQDQGIFLKLESRGAIGLTPSASNWTHLLSTKVYFL